MEEREYSYLEVQANNFGGHILVPQKFLDHYFKIELKKFAKSFLDERFKNLIKEDYIDLILELISQKLVPIFQVSPRVIEVRIIKSNLTNLIP